MKNYKKTVLKIARKIMGKELFVEIYGKKNLPKLYIRIELRHDRNRKQFERVFPIGEDVEFEGYATAISYPSYIIDRFFWLENKDRLTKSVTITKIEIPVNN